MEGHSVLNLRIGFNNPTQTIRSSCLISRLDASRALHSFAALMCLGDLLEQIRKGQHIAQIRRMSRCGDTVKLGITLVTP